MHGNFCAGEFWDVNETWNSQTPLFSPCFEDLIFTSSPCILFSIILVLGLFDLRRNTSHNTLPWTWLNKSKICLSGFLFIISASWCAVTLYEKFTHENVPHSSLISSCSRVAIFLLVSITMLKDRYCGVLTSNTLSLLWICLSICSVVLYRTVILNNFFLNSPSHPKVILVFSMMYYPVIFIQLILSIFADKKKFSTFHNTGENKIMDPVPFLQGITFLWFTKLVYKSRQKILEVGDLSFNKVTITAGRTYEKFSKHWKHYLFQGQKKNRSLGWALFKAFWKYSVTAICLDFLMVILELLPALLLDRIIDFASDDYYSWRGYLFATAIFLTDLVSKLTENNSDLYMSSTSIQYQSSLMMALFRKNLRISTATRRTYNSGTLMNLLSVDADRVQWFVYKIVALTTVPLKIVLIVYIMWQYIGSSTLAGVAVIFVLFPISSVIMRFGWKFEDKQMKVKDIRLKCMNEILNGIKILKLYAWEIPFAAKVTDARREEIKWIRYNLFGGVVLTFIYYCTPFLVSLASFSTFLLTDHTHVLTPTRAFVTLTLMDQLTFGLFQLPNAITELIQFNVSLKRLKEFFNSENMDTTIIGDSPDKGEAVTVRNASLSWDADSEPFLHDITLHIPVGKLIAVIGPVGSGKSALLSTILGEMCKKTGSIDIMGTLAYVPQQSWILNRTLKSNILLVKSMAEEKYNKILDLCCLRPDLEILPAGDMTEIGEKGINLSGGQKLRINLAQAVYQNKDIYLLDDPLSAVDVHVRKALFKDVIGNTGLLRNKTRLLVTHDLSVLHEVDLIISMKEGRIDEIGTYKELIQRNGSFTSFVEEYGTVKTPEADALKEKKVVSRMSSQISITSKSSIDRFDLMDFVKRNDDTNSDEITHRLIDDERMEVGGVHRRIYWNYVKRIGFLLFFVLLFGYIGHVTFQAGANIWLSNWSSDSFVNGTVNVPRSIWRLSIYGAFGFAQVVSIAIGTGLLVYGVTKASTSYHKDMLLSILKSPMSFFDTTPIGRIINRFTTDTEVLDNQLFYRVDSWITCVLTVLGSFVVIGMNIPYFLIALLPLGIIYYTIQKLHMNTIRQIKRLESTTKSPIISLFMESIQGVSSVTAYNVQKEFIQNFEEKLDRSFVCTLNYFNSDRWLNFGLDFLGSTVVFIATLLAIVNRHELTPATVGLIVTYALTVTQSLKWLVKVNSDFENQIISIERIDEYCHLNPEAPWDLPHEELQKNWPQEGNISFINYSTKYREDLDLVLKNVNLMINSGEKVGVIGRTGAGKSSFTLALFRVIEPQSGTILIDDIDITKIGLHDLRSKLTIIPQDPVLFTGTLRMNLDPNIEHTDDEIWESLEKSYLKSFVSNLSEGLNYELEENGSNLSAGQKQLVCLTRALLKNTKILVLDEATASVDMDTDSLIQETIRTAFADHTVITIAHRLNTVLDYDKIVVMERGNLIEVGNPSQLLKNTESKFYIMCKEAKLV